MKRYGTAYLMLALMCLCAWQTHAAEVEPFIEVSHTSSLLQGRPFNNQDGGTQIDAVMAGITIAAGKWEIDLAHGRKRINQTTVEPGSTLAVRFYPWRKR